MRDIFYFTRAEVTFEDIVACAEFNGYTGYIEDYGELLIEYHAKQYWRIIKVDETDFYEEVNKIKLADFRPRSQFQVYYNSSSSASLKLLLACLLNRYDSWVGLNDAWQQTFTLATIDQMTL